MSDSTGTRSVVEKLQQSLLDFKDHMSVYTTHVWSESGHGYNEAERLGFRDAPVPAPCMIGRGPGPGTRHSAVEQRIGIDREMEAPSHGTSHGHFEGGSRNKFAGPLPPGFDYGCPPVENGYGDDNFHRDNRTSQPYMDMDRSRTDPGYYKGPTRPYGPEARPCPHGGEGSYPMYESDVLRCDYRHPPPPPIPTSYPGSNLPMPLEDRNPGMPHRGYNPYSPSQQSWSPNIDTPDSTSSPNAYPCHPPSPLPRHSETFPIDAGRPPMAADRLYGRTSADVNWRTDARRRGFLLMRTEEKYFLQQGRGDPPYPRQPNHLRSDRDPRLRRTQQPYRASSPQSHNPSGVHPAMPRISNARRVSQILTEHAYFRKGEPGIGAESNARQADQSWLESQPGTCSLPRHMLSHVTTKSPMSQGKNRSLLKSPEGALESLGKPELSKAAVGEESQLKAESRKPALPDSTSKFSIQSQSTEAICSCKEKGEGKMVPSQSLQIQPSPTDDISSPESPALSLSSFEIDLDTEPGSSDEDGEDDEDEIVPNEPPVFISVCGSYNDQSLAHLLAARSGSPEFKNRKMTLIKESVTQKDVEVEPAKVRRCNNRILRNGRVLPRSTTSVVYSTRKPKLAVAVDNKVPSVRLSLTRDSFSSHSKAEDDTKQDSESQDGPPTRTRRSKRLACTTQDNDLEYTKVNSATELSVIGTSPEDDRTSNIAMDVRNIPGASSRAELIMNLAAARAVKAENEKKRALQKMAKTVNQRTTRAAYLRKRKGDESLVELPRRRRRRKTPEFVPEILPTKSRTETATLKRRKEMEIQIQQNERERLETARPEETERRNTPSPVLAEPTDSSQDDFSSQASTISSRDVDSTMSSKSSSLLDEFPPDIAIRCKRVSSVRSCSGDTPLHKVCRTGKYDLAKYFIFIEKASVNVQDYAGWTPLHEACGNCNTEVAELLLQNGADANISATDGTRPIHDAIEVGSLELVKLLIQYGADPLAEQGEKTPAEFALDMDQPEIHSYLLSILQDLKAHQSKSATTSEQPVKSKASSKAEEKKQSNLGNDDLMIPVDGYTSDDPKFGVELDHPLFFVSPIIEMSDTPFLPVYNLEVVPGKNPRRHNFHLLNDVLTCLNITESELRKKCHGIKAVELTVADVRMRLKSSFKYREKLPPSFKCLANETKVKLIPLCAQLRCLFDVYVENLDD